MKIFFRLFKEFWIPALTAIAWTAYNTHSPDFRWDFKKIVNVFGPSFFLASWATGQFFRVQKQTHVENNLTNIERRLGNLIDRLEKHTQDFFGYTTGSDSVAYFLPMFTSREILELGLINSSTYPVFDIQAEVIDLDEPIDPANGKFWTRHRFLCGSLYPNKIATSAYRFDLTNRGRLNINIFIQTRTQNIQQQLRLARLGDNTLFATKTTAGDKTIELRIPEDFPGYDKSDPEAVFK